MLDSKHRCKDTKDKFNPFALSALQSRTGSEKATGKNLFSLQGTPVLITGSLFSLRGLPCKPLYFSVGDCSVLQTETCYETRHVNILSIYIYI